MVPCIVVDGDTLPFFRLPEYEVISKRRFRNLREEQRYKRLVYNVKTVYPYAKLAGEKLLYFEDLLAKEKSERKRDKIMKQAEKDIRKQFDKELMALTFSQGKILLKLVDRETSNTSFHLVKSLRGNFRAYFYQGVGRIFGYNLKTQYEPWGEDRDIENIVLLIEAGRL